MKTEPNHGRPAPWESTDFGDITIPEVLELRGLTDGDSTAYRVHTDGGFLSVTWSAMRHDAAALAAGLIQAGVDIEDRVVILGDACRELVVAELAVWSARAISVSVYSTASVDELRHIFADTQPAACIVQDRSFCERLHLLATADSTTRQFFFLKPAQESDGCDAEVAGHPVRYLSDLTREFGEEQREVVRRRRESARPDDPISITYTSGTTGRAKGVMHSHTSLLSGARARFLSIPGLQSQAHRTLVTVPMSHIAPKLSVIIRPLLSRTVPHFASESREAAEILHAVQPTFVVQPPRLYEKAAQAAVGSLERRPWPIRWVYRHAIRLAKKHVSRSWDERPVPVWLAAPTWLARRLVFRPLLADIGYGQLRIAYTGSAPSNGAMVALWHAWGVDLRQSYGSTEAGGMVASTTRSFSRPSVIGQTPAGSGFEVTTSDDGELLFRAPSTCVGIWGDEAAMSRLFAPDGWLRTGDLATIDDRGEITLLGRRSNSVTTSGGKTINVHEIETLLRELPYISHVVVFGDGRKYLTAGLEVDARKLSAADPVDLREARLREEIWKALTAVNTRFSRPAQIKDFFLVPVGTLESRGVLTSNGKLNRRKAVEAFYAEIEAMYPNERVTS